MPNNYRFWQPALQPSPLQGPYGQAWGTAFGLVKDALIDRMKQSVKTKFPLVCPPDALALLGLERGIVRGASETNAAYAVRVQKAWDSWQWAGSAFGVLSQLFAIGYTSTVILSRGITYQLNAAGQLVILSSQAKGLNPYWSNFCVIVPHPFPTVWMSTNNWQVRTMASSAGRLNAFSGVPSPDYNFCVKIGTGGFSGGAATYLVSLDGGFTFPGSAIALAASGNNLSVSGTGGAGIPTFGTNASLFTAGDLCYPSQIPPADGSVDSNIFRSVIAEWKPAGANCTSITVLMNGWLYGYPAGNYGAAHPPWGGQQLVSWAPPPN